MDRMGRHLVRVVLALAVLFPLSAQQNQGEIERLQRRVAELEKELKIAKEALAAEQAKAAAAPALTLRTEPLTREGFERAMRTQDTMKATMAGKVVVEAEQFLSQNPESWEALFLYGRALLNSHRFAEAKEAFEKCVLLTNSPYPHYGLALVSVASKMWVQAHGQIFKAMAAEPSSFLFREVGSRVAYELGKERFKLRRFVDALEFLKESVQLGTTGDKFAAHRNDLVILCEAYLNSKFPALKLPASSKNEQVVLEVNAVKRGVDLALEAVDYDAERSPTSDYLRRWVAAYRMGSDYLGLEVVVRNPSANLLVVSPSFFAVSGDGEETFLCSEWLELSSGLNAHEESRGTLVFKISTTREIKELKFDNYNPYSSINLTVPLQ